MSYFRDGRLVWQERRRKRRRDREREPAEGEGTNRVEKEGRVRKGRKRKGVSYLSDDDRREASWEESRDSIRFG